MISSDAPVLLGKACEFFIMELTFRSWLHTEEDRRRTMQIGDVSHAISDAKTLKFIDALLPDLQEPQFQVRIPSLSLNIFVHSDWSCKKWIWVTANYSLKLWPLSKSGPYWPLVYIKNIILREITMRSGLLYMSVTRLCILKQKVLDCLTYM